MFKTRVFVAVLLAVAIAGFGGQQPWAAPQEPAAQGGAPAQSAGQSAEQPATPDQPATFRTGVDFIRVDVFATDRNGQPVKDLKETDFEVLEDGQAQKVEQFQYIQIDGPGSRVPDERPRAIRSVTDEETEAQRDDVRLFAIFLDDYHVRASNSISVREPLTRFIETQLRPNDMVAIMYPLTPTTDVMFTRDHAAIVRAIQQFEGRKYDYTPRNMVERNYEREPTEVVERIRNQVVMGALEGLSLKLGGLRDGRKSILFVSEGFTVMLPPQMRRANAQAPQPFGTGVVDQRTEEMAEIQGQMDLDSRMREVYRAANRNNTAVYSLDPRGLAAFEFDISDGAGGPIGNTEDAKMLRSTQETLRALSIETDGRAIVNRNTLLEGLTQMVRDSSVYYLLGYSTPNPADGKFHEIRVRVKRPGVNIRARRGYWALSPEAITRANAPRAPELAKPIQNALATLSTSVQAARFVRTWIGTERGEAGKTRVTLVWEPLPVQPGVRREQAGRLTLLAADPQGGSVFRGRSPSGDAAAPAAASSAASTAPRAAGAATPAAATASQRIVFEAAPGKLDLRMTIEAAAGGTLDTENRTVDIPDLTAPVASMSTPRVFRSRTAREFQALTADANAVPVAIREFSRTERLLIRFDAYAPGSEQPAPTAAVLTRTGQKVSDIPVAAAAAGGSHQIELALNSMAAGEYLLEIAVKSATGDEAKEYIAFRVGV
jgi:VWFA-related protein